VPEIENGLSELESRRRNRPAPQHPKRPVVVPPPAVILPEALPSDDELVRVAPAAAAPLRSAPVESPARAVVPRRAAASPVRATQVYLDEETMDFLRTCSAAGLMAGSRDVTNSGVIRYAVARLAGQLNPEQVADALLNDSNTARRSPGRPRR